MCEMVKTYGGIKDAYVVTKRIQVRVCHDNQDMRALINEHKGDPQYFLTCRDAFFESPTRAKKWLADVIDDYREYFVQGLVDFVFESSG